MPIKIQFGIEALYAFLLTLTRVGSALVLLPLPGFKNSPEMARVLLIFCITICLFPRWPAVNPDQIGLSRFILIVLSETAFGLSLGLALSLLTESFQLGAQIISSQTGFSFASTFDPASEADSSILQVLCQLLAGFLFFSLQIDHQLLTMFARSMDFFSPGTHQPDWKTAQSIIHLGSMMFVTGIKLALPVASLLFLIDIALATISRIQPQMQLLLMAFPAKILLTLFFLASCLMLWPQVYERLARQLIEITFHAAFR